MSASADQFPGKPTAPNLVNAHFAEDNWCEPEVIKAATGDFLARLNFYHGDDDLDRDHK